MHPESYIADTVDLTRDDEARDYWLACFEDSLAKVMPDLNYDPFERKYVIGVTNFRDISHVSFMTSTF